MNSFIFMTIVSLTLQTVLASEVQVFRDELERNQSEAKISYREYQTELDKLLNPKPVRSYSTKIHTIPSGSYSNYHHTYLLY